MKTFETEKHNIPEGATGYREQGQYIEWFSGSNGNWRLIKSNVPSLAMCDALLPIIPIPQHEVEWNGEGLPPVGVECEFSCEGFWGDSDYHWCRFLGLLSDKSYAIEFHHPTSPSRVTCQCFDPQCTSFRKPESPQQREESERLEAAYDLYCEWRSSKGCESFEAFSNCNVDNWLAIVNKTNYRKESN